MALILSQVAPTTEKKAKIKKLKGKTRKSTANELMEWATVQPHIHWQPSLAIGDGWWPLLMVAGGGATTVRGPASPCLLATMGTGHCGECGAAPPPFKQHQH